MNWLDILLIILNIFAFVGGIITIIVAIIRRNECWSIAIPIAITYWVFYITLGWLLWMPFIVLDKASGNTIGTITSVDKNFFGTTALYIKTTETNEEKYCIEFNENLESKAKELIGKKVKISYGKRVGFYLTGKCHQAPIETIEEMENEISNK